MVEETKNKCLGASRFLLGVVMGLAAFVIGVFVGAFGEDHGNKETIKILNDKRIELQKSYNELEERYNYLWDSTIELSTAYSNETSNSSSKKSSDLTIIERLENLENYVDFMHGEMDILPISGNEIKMDGGNEYFWINRDTIINYGNAEGTKSRAILAFWSSWSLWDFYDINTGDKFTYDDMKQGIMIDGEKAQIQSVIVLSHEEAEKMKKNIYDDNLTKYHVEQGEYWNSTATYHQINRPQPGDVKGGD